MTRYHISTPGIEDTILVEADDVRIRGNWLMFMINGDDDPVAVYNMNTICGYTREKKHYA